MTFTDIIGHSSKLFHSFSMNNNLNKKDQHRKLKRLNPILLNLFPPHRQTKHFKRKDVNEQAQQRNCFLHPSSMMTISDLSRSISTRSITFASVFDELQNENNNHSTFDLGKSIENEDLVIVVPNKYVENEPRVNSSNTEPYPFRSEIPSCSLPKSHSSTNMVSSFHSTKKSLHHLIHSHRPKKLRHPVKINQSVHPNSRAKSTPNLLISSSSNSNSITNDHHRSLKTFRQWFKSSSFGRFFQSFVKHPNGNTNASDTKHLKQKSRVKPTFSRKFSDLIY